MKTVAFFTCLLLAAQSNGKDSRDYFVKTSPMVKAIKGGLKLEQGLSCNLTKDESGNVTIQYITEDNRSKFIALLLCSNGQSAVIKGAIGDSGQTAVEEFRMTWAN